MTLLVGGRYYVRHRRPSQAEMKAEAVGRALAGGTFVVPPENAPPAPQPERPLLPALFTEKPRADVPALERRATQRVEGLLRAWRHPGAAAAIWTSGNLSRPGDTARFERWQREKALDLGIHSYTIGDVYRASGEYTVVDVTVNGAPLHIGVPDGERPLFWTAY